jgi:hypothetical protein
MFNAKIHKRLRHSIPPPHIQRLDQQISEFFPPPIHTMMYPPAALNFLGNSIFSSVSPHFVVPVYGSGGGGKSRRDNTGVPPSAAKTPRPSASKKARKSSALPPSARRTSPRTANNNQYATVNISDDQRQRLGEGNNLMSQLPPIAEIEVPPSYSEEQEDNLSEDLLAPSQPPPQVQESQLTIVPGTELQNFAAQNKEPSLPLPSDGGGNWQLQPY